MSNISPHVYLSSIVYAKDRYWLKKNRIQYILIIGDLPMFYPNQFQYKKISILDQKDQNIRKFFEECFEYIEKAINEKKNILVHCYGGQSRSSTIIIGYLMYKHKQKFKDVYQQVKQLHQRCEPNEGFIQQLQQFEKELEEK